MNNSKYDLDLDINNYSIKDLEKFFGLQSKSKYSSADIELKEYNIREQLLTSGQVNKKFKRDLIQFLTEAKDWLIYVKCNPHEKKPTTIPKNYKLDSSNIPASKDVPSRSGDLIVRPETQFIHTMTDDFFPGKLNPLNTRVITKCLNIDTRFRDNLFNTQSSDFTFQLPIKFSKVVSMQLSAIELPVVFYGISKYNGNNFLYMAANYNSFTDSGESFTDEVIITIPDGNYSGADFISNLNSQLCPTGSDNSITYPNSVFSYIQFSLDINLNGSGSGRSTVSATGVRASYINSITFDFTRDINGVVDNVPITRKMGQNLGFILPHYEGQTSYTSETMVEPSTVRYIYLIVDDYNHSVNDHFVSAFNKSLNTSNILARIPIKSSYFSIVMENDFNIIAEPRKYFGPVDIHKIRVQLIQETGDILAMNNSNYSFCINFKMLYDL